jgi:hypothetical protein
MGTGQPQTVNFAVSTGLGYSAVATPECTDCAQSGGFNPDLSTSLQHIAGNATAQYGGLDLSGNLVREDCGLVTTNPSLLWKYTNQTLVLSRSRSGLFSDTIGGIIGLGFGAPAGGAQEDTVVGKWLSTHPANTTFDVGMAINDLSSTLAKQINKELEEDTGAGQMHTAAPNSSFYDADKLTWSKATRAVIGTLQSGESGETSTGGYSSDYVFELASWKFEGADAFSISSVQPAQAIFEPLFPSIVFPQRFANSIYGSVNGAQEIPNSDPKQWTVPCETGNMVWTAVYNGLEIPSRNLVLRAPTSGCVGAIQGWRNEEVTSFLLGTPAMANAYIIHQTSQQGLSQVGVAPRLPLLFPKRSESSRAALIGGVVGGVVGGLLLVALGICIFYKKIRRKERIHVNETAPVMPFGVTEPFTPPHTGSHLLTMPLGPQTAVTPSSGTSYHDGPATASPSLHGSTFAAQQAAGMQQVRDAKGRQLFTAVSRPTLDSVESPPTTASVADTQGSRRPMLPPAYD